MPRNLAQLAMLVAEVAQKLRRFLGPDERSPARRSVEGLLARLGLKPEKALLGGEEGGRGGGGGGGGGREEQSLPASARGWQNLFPGDVSESAYAKVQGSGLGLGLG